MSDITAAIEQDQIANSLLSESDQAALAAETEGYDRSLAGVIDRGDEKPQEQRDDWAEINAELRGETERIEQAARPEQEAPSEVTPQSVQEGIAQLEATVNELGLNDPGEASLLASSLGVDPAHSAPLGSVLAKSTLSALGVLEQCGGDLSKVGAIPRESALAFSNDFLRALGVDPRMSQADPQQLADIVLGGTLSFLQAVQTYGLNASLDQLNSAEASQWFVNSLFQCFGQKAVDREYALSIADAGGRYVLSVLRKLDAQQAQQPRQGRQSQGARSSGRGQRAGGRGRFKTNTDLFDDEAMSIWQREHGRI